jgi:hypothetical protein
MVFRRIWYWVVVLFALSGPAWAGTAAFDLPGPRIEVRVTRAGKTLPISQVPNLQEGDRIWVHPDLPDNQSVHYLLIAAFLRGSTNPPPESWFIKAETWNKRIHEEGIVLTVPKDAQQVLMFLAPETGGDFNTLRSTVRGKPGAFVRASQDLNQASLDRTRLDTYLDLLRKTSDSSPDALHDRSVLLARSLNIKTDPLCFVKPVEQQLPCLTENTDSLVLEDGHSQSMVNTLTSGASSDLIGQLSTTKVAGGGLYSPYVGAIVDVARLLDSFHNPQYQYIPALAVPSRGELNLKLNNPPSFKKPMSVLVIGLPPVEPAQTPPLRPLNANDALCMQKPGLVLPAEGAPLVFSSDLAHDFVFQVKNKAGEVIDLPAKPDPTRGGFAIDAQKAQGMAFDPDIKGTLRGYWGFKQFDGPTFRMWNAHSMTWSLAAADKMSLIVGRNDAVHLQAENAACVDDINLKNQQGREVDTTWKQVKPSELEVQVPLKNESAGQATLLVKQFGLAEPDKLAIQTYSEAGHLDEFRINAGDREGTLKGTRLDEVTGLDVKGVHFAPLALSRAEGRDELRLQGPEGAASAFQPGESVGARVVVKDGRTLELKTSVDQPRPKVSLVSKNVEPGPSAEAVHLGSENELPQDGRLSFFLKTEVPAVFPRNEKIEVSTEDGALTTQLGLEDGSLVLEDSQSVLAQLDPMKSFGVSAFGPLRFRPVHADGRKGDWQPLVTLVRVPFLTDVRCTPAPDKQCTLSGTNLFLIDSVAANADFSDGVSVPMGITTASVTVPRPTGSVLYIKLRDDPNVVSTATLPAIAKSAANTSSIRRAKVQETNN